MKVLFVSALKEESNDEVELIGNPILHTGVGKVNAGWKVALAINEYKPDLVCNFGGCGSFLLKKGSIVTVMDVYNGDMDATPLVPYSVTPFDGGESGLNISGSGVNCFTSDTFITHEKVERFSNDKLELFKNCEIFDMELYSIARVCQDMKTPLISYKWVTDDGGIEDWKENCKIGYDKFKNEFAQRYNEYVRQYEKGKNTI